MEINVLFFYFLLKCLSNYDSGSSLTAKDVTLASIPLGLSDTFCMNVANP